VSSPITLPESLIQLLKQPAYCHISTLMPDGSPHITITWVDTDGEHIFINTVEGYQKLRNVRRDPRVALNIVDPNNPVRAVGVRGRVIDITTDGAVEQIQQFSQKYLGRPYPGDLAHSQRVSLIIAVEHINHMPNRGNSSTWSS
jgi:PPOX class probable F420-dependent enzyme